MVTEGQHTLVSLSLDCDDVMTRLFVSGFVGGKGKCTINQPALQSVDCEGRWMDF